MQTFIKKISRNSGFEVVIPEEVKRQYNLEIGQIVFFEIANRNNGVVAIHKEVEVADVEGNTGIVIPQNELASSENSGLQDDEIYEYRIVAYSSEGDSDSESETTFFNRLEEIKDFIFCFS